MRKELYILVVLLAFCAFSAQAKVNVQHIDNEVLEQKDAVDEDEVKKSLSAEDNNSININNVTASSNEVETKEKSRLQKRREELAIERAKETRRFKKKAISNTERRERRHEEILREKRENESRFQKEARERKEREMEEAKEREKNEIKTRFQIMAEERAEERARKREEKEKKLKRNRDK